MILERIPRVSLDLLFIQSFIQSVSDVDSASFKFAECYDAMTTDPVTGKSWNQNLTNFKMFYYAVLWTSFHTIITV